jgi:HD-like signal output (HDOD) protein
MDFSSSLADAIDQMPGLPETFRTAMLVQRDTSHEAKELLVVVRKDPVITMKLLKVVNSAHFGFARQVASLEQAMLVLGTNSFRNLVMAFCSMNTLPRDVDARFDFNRFYLHALSVAALARELASFFKDSSASESYTVGLLHDFGQLVLAWRYPKEFVAMQQEVQQSNLLQTQAEYATFGTDHANLGATLAFKWALPQSLVSCIRDHHQLAPIQGLGRCLYLANQLFPHLTTSKTTDLDLKKLLHEMTDITGLHQDVIATILPSLSRGIQEAQSILTANQIANYGDKTG